MIRDQIRELKTGPREVRRFGLSVGGVLAGLGAWLSFRHQPAGPFLIVLGSVLMGIGPFAPGVLRPVYIGWMALAFALGSIVSALVLTLFFFLVVTPIGLIARAAGQDFLDRKWDAAASTYWTTRRATGREEKSTYERQF